MKPFIQYFSDCSFFAGCENMLANFFNAEDFRSVYEIGFFYRYSPAYEKGLSLRVHHDLGRRALRLFDHTSLFEVANSTKLFPVRIALKVLGQSVKIANFIRDLFVLRNLFKAQPMDILHINNGSYPGALSCNAAVLAAASCGIKNIIYVVNNIAVPYSTMGRLMDFPVDRLVVRRVSRFVTGSRFAAEALKSVLRLGDTKVISIPNGISPRQVSESPSEFRVRLGLPRERLLIGTVSVLEERKGHLILLESILRLKTSHPAFELPIILIEGKGSQEADLKKFVEDNKLQDIVRFVGVEPEIFNFLNGINILAHPSIAQEDFPNSILEAMSLGKPVIASNICGIPEQISNEINGLLVEPNDPEALAAAIFRLLGDSSLLETLGSKARHIFNEKFSASLSVEKYRDLYQSLLGGENKLKAEILI